MPESEVLERLEGFLVQQELPERRAIFAAESLRAFREHYLGLYKAAFSGVIMEASVGINEGRKTRFQIGYSLMFSKLRKEGAYPYLTLASVDRTLSDRFENEVAYPQSPNPVNNLFFRPYNESELDLLEGMVLVEHNHLIQANIGSFKLD